MEIKIVRSGKRPQAARGQNWVEDKIALRKKKNCSQDPKVVKRKNIILARGRCQKAKILRQSNNG